MSAPLRDTTVVDIKRRDHVRRFGWLVNISGHRNGFCPLDLAQEHNIRDIKVSNESVTCTHWPR